MTPKVYQHAGPGQVANVFLWIPGVIPGMNEILDAGKLPQFSKKKMPPNFNPYQKLKKKWSQDIALLARVQGFAVTGPHWQFVFVEAARRRDPSNFIAAGLKLIPDALQDAGLIPNDGWKEMATVAVDYYVDKTPGVRVWTGEEPWTS